jgi:hypothetical protein
MKTLHFNRLDIAPPPRITAIIEWEQAIDSGLHKLTEYRVHGKCQREDGPARIRRLFCRCGTCDVTVPTTEEEWLRFGRPHREFAPAFIVNNGKTIIEETWWLKGERYEMDDPESFTEYWSQLYKKYKRKDVGKARICMSKLLGDNK